MDGMRDIDRRELLTGKLARPARGPDATVPAPPGPEDGMLATAPAPPRAVQERPASEELTEAAARELTERILALSEADGTEVSVGGGWRGNTRFAVNRVTTAGDAREITANITARFGRRQASASTNRFDDESLERAVRDAERLARLAPEDPEMMPLLGPQDYHRSRGWYETTAALDAARRSAVPSAAIGMAREAGGLEVAGFLDCQAGGFAIANSEGLFAYHRATEADYTITVRTDDGTGSGWAGQAARDWSALDHETLSRRAVEKARLSRDPRPLEPGRYTVVLEPAAVADLVGLVRFALDARQADEGRSPFSAQGGGTRIGEQIVDERVTVRSDPAAVGSSPFTQDGLPLEPIDWVENGVLRNLFYTRFWAEEQGVEPTGFPTTLLMSGGEGDVEDLIAGTERGVLVTRFWYIRAVDPRTLVYTGLTRDGTFLIEDGEIAHPVNNFRWNDSPLFVLRNLEAMSRPVRVDASVEVPAIRAREFNFSSVSEAV